jgi:Beta-carotene isomerase D27-like, C-terminal
MQPKAVPTIVTDEYNDNLLDRLFIWLFSHKMSQALGAGTQLSGYSGVVDLSKQIMHGRNAQQQQIIVARILQSFVPVPVLWAIRTFFTPTRLVCVLNAWFAARMFGWLVGPCEVTEAEIDLPDGTIRSQPSAVQIKKCRYLADSGCVGMCVNMCKVPTQEFFTEKFGIPLTMKPNFEDLSCQMIFGQIPPLPAVDDAFQQPCLEQQDFGRSSICPKLR